jgi:ABC-type lipoprotein release transport system permease subunit
MKMLFQLSWRNIWRHPARSAVLLAAVAAGLWGGLMFSGLANGWVQQRLDRLIENEISHLQVHHPEYQTEREAGMYMPEALEMMRALEADPSVRAVTARTLADAMAQSPVTAAGVRLRGILPESERRTTALHDDLIEGRFLDEADVRYPVVLGQRLAERLKIGVGNRLVLTFQDLNNELTSAAFNISGIFSTSSAAYDERNVFVRAEDLYGLLAGRPVFHEVAMLLHDIDQSETVAAALNDRYPEVRAQTWFELSPELRYMDDVGGQYTYYIMLVILAALAFGILNTMLMAIFERMHELGMLMAVGMNRLRVFGMIMLETVMLTLVGAMAGMGLSVITVSWFYRNGLDLTPFGGESFAAFGYDAIVYPFLTPDSLVGVTLLVILTAVLASIYPSIKALRLKPAQAIRE